MTLPSDFLKRFVVGSNAWFKWFHLSPFPHQSSLMICSFKIKVKKKVDWFILLGKRESREGTDVKR